MSPVLSAAPVNPLPKMELIPPVNADVEGVFRAEGRFKGRIIYTSQVIDAAATKKSARIKTDKDGNDIWKRHPSTGEPQYPKMVKDIIMRTKRYILVGNDVARTVKMVENFEPTAQELEDIKTREAEADFMKMFVTEAVANGLTAAQVVQRIKADALEPGEDAELQHKGEEITEEVVQRLAKEADLEAQHLAQTALVEASLADDPDEVAVKPGETVSPEKSDYETDNDPTTVG